MRRGQFQVLTSDIETGQTAGMPRPLRIEYPGAIYHIINRGDRREAIFLDEAADRELFWTTLAEACRRTGWQVHAWCLMSNHFHLVVETPRPNLVAGMKWLLGTYTQRFNRKHRLGGHLFQGRYKAHLIDGERTGYVRAACDYTHLNPARAGLIDARAALESWRWSSYPQYLRAARFRAQWLRTDRLFGEHGIQTDNVRGRRELARRMEARRLEPEQPDTAAAHKALRGGWRLGAEDFLARLLELSGRPAQSGHGRGVHEETEEGIARRIIVEELGRRRWEAGELARRAKGDAVKIAIAKRLRGETALTLAQIAELLQMGTATHVAHLLYHRAGG